MVQENPNAVEGPKRLPLSLLAFVLPDVALACIMVLRPPFMIRFVASLLLIYTIVYTSMTYTLGNAGDDYALGSTGFGTMLLNVMLFTWLLDAVKDVHYLRCPGSMAERPLWTRFWHSLCVLHNSRLVGTNAQVANVPPPFKGTRTQYLLRRIREVLGGLVMFDFIETFIHSHHHLYDPSRNDAHFPSGLLGYFERSACMAVWLVMTYIVLKISYGALTIVAVGTHLWSAEDWPDIYGDLSDAYTIRRLWGRTWHQVLRRHFAHWGNWTVNTLNVPRGTFLSSQVQVHVAFALSGLLHCIGDLVVGKEVFGHSWKFFAANGIAITFEDVVILLARRIGFRHMTRVTRVVGYVWVCLWFTRSVRLYQEWMYEAGIGNQPALPYSPTKEILVPYIRRIAGL